MHFFLFSSFLGHLLPPLEGSVITDLVLVTHPLPQVTEQCDLLPSVVVPITLLDWTSSSVFFEESGKMDMLKEASLPSG